jgi:hypothetical protein
MQVPAARVEARQCCVYMMCNSVVLAYSVLPRSLEEIAMHSLAYRVLSVTLTYRGYPVNLPKVRLFVHLASVQWSQLIYVTGVSDSRSKFL